MVKYLFDTSAFTKRYHKELGSERVRAIFEASSSRVMVSNLTIVETQSAFGVKVRTRAILGVDADLAMDQVFLEIAKGLVGVAKLTDGHLEGARILIRKYGYLKALKTLDALQLALAMALRRAGELDVFVIADRAFGEIAALEGLPVEDPQATTS